ncbi:kinase-like domain-containing protein [Bisporella sp. PMI_857]|nr:kinase-like domain-containing protein [Bisporella sp. PMI_857]
MTTNTSFAPQGSVNLVDLRYSITQTRTNFTRLRENFSRAQGNEPLPDFITLTSLICDIYRRHGDDLAPICQIQSSEETQYNKGHTSTVSHTKIPGLRASKVSDDTLNTQSQTLIVKRPRQSILEEQSYALISFITELRIRTHPPLRDHPSIARFHGICWDFEDEEATIPRPLLLEELAPQGALDNFWQRWNFVRMNFKPKLDMCRDVAEGLLALHHCGVVHGDVKPENLLVFPRPNGKDEFMVKLTDFGHSVFEHNRLNALPAFTPQWCAPEATKATTMSFKDMIATDCYSYGLVTLSVMIGRPFHVDVEDVETHKQGDTLLTKAVDIIEKEDKENTESDLNLDVIRRLLNHTVQLNKRRRNLKHCLSIIKR